MNSSLHLISRLQKSTIIMPNYLRIICCMLVLSAQLAGQTENTNWTFSETGFTFSWDLKNDKAQLHAEHNKAFIWSGSLLPGFWISPQTDSFLYLKGKLVPDQSTITERYLKLTLDLSPYGHGEMEVERRTAGFEITRLSINWKDSAPAIISMYFGATKLSEQQMAHTMDAQYPFAPDWSAFGFCVPGAKEGPAQSYFRNWDLGRADIPLGNFGPSMGAPYGAAFPRPTLMAAMGNDAGWINFGAASIPDAPMTLQVRSGHGSIHYLYREDLWGTPAGSSRTWQQLLRMTFGQNAWQAMRSYVSSIPNTHPTGPEHHLAVWNTWGNWKTQNYAISPITEMASKLGAEILVLDDPWESSQGSGTYSRERFPNFKEEIQNIHQSRLQHGIWETLAWINEPDSLGLTHEDLILDQHGHPCKGSWNFDPFWKNHYLLDISSDDARNFLIKRTRRVMQEVQPQLIKLDFGYGISNPNVGVPRDPAIRGERYVFELAKVITETAKSVNPDVTIMYYGISPLYLPLFDMISLDDQGDLWYAHSDGHGQWSIWASLISSHHIALNGSSGYNWQSDDEILLNTAILGSPGSVLPNTLDGKPIPEQYINRRYALNNWYRQTIQWEPIWFNTELGGMEHPMKINCWGRAEYIDNKLQITALALRSTDNTEQESAKHPTQYQWTGRWALISQDDADIASSTLLSVIPFDDASSISFPLATAPTAVQIVNVTSKKAYRNWSWQDGRMNIQLEAGLLASTAGFLITSSKK